jgi:uncharacterized membrane protein
VFLSPYVVTEADPGPAEVVFPQFEDRFTIGTFSGLSADGSLAVGLVETDDAREAVRWTEAGGFELLASLPGGSDAGSGNATSADGSVIFGSTASARGSEASRWTAADDVISLGDLTSSEEFASAALAATADGLVAVGRSSAGAFVWDEASGMRELRQVLADEFGLDLDGWTLAEATGISADGRVIVGNGTNPSGQREGWVATIPEPSTALLLATGLALVSRMRPRSG